MKALQFDDSIPRYVLAKAIGWLAPSAFWSGLGCLRYRDVPEPALPGPEWVRVQVRYGGICGSDLNTITLHDSPSLSAVSSFPFTMGHESVGLIDELGSDVEGFALGDRVVVEPLLGCVTRGFRELCPACARGDLAVCERRTNGALAAGTMIGFCASTGGSWSSHYAAHRSQLLRVPQGVGDESALLCEPFSVALRAVLRNPPPDGGTVLVLGAGTIGLCAVAAVRALGFPNRLAVVAKYPFQSGLARRCGADEVILSGRDGALAEILKARLHRPILGKPLVSGGAELIYECIGSDTSLSTAIRFTREGGRTVILGLAAIPKGIDWAPIWLKETEIHGSYTYGFETWQGRRVRTFQLALEMMAQGRVNLGHLVTHRFRLESYRRAFRMVTQKARHRLVKAAFAF